MSNSLLFNDKWQFSKQPLTSSYDDLRTFNFQWENVSLPHDWLIYNTHNLYENSKGWYLKYYEVTELTKKHRKILHFDGVYMNSYLYVNSNLVGTWKYGYTTFEFDITDYLLEGTNEIVLEVIHEAPNSRWYSGAGIYRNVWLKTVSSIHIPSDGIYISTRRTEGGWYLDISTEITYSYEMPEHDIEVEYIVKDDTNKVIASLVSNLNPELLEGHITTYNHTLSIDNPKLWDITSPILHTLETRILLCGHVIDYHSQTFGFRTIRFHSMEGFFLNDRKVKLHGVCEHHDLGCLGSAINKEAIKKRLTLLQHMGVNAIRTGHVMPDKAFMELADTMGFLIVSESFDMWERKKTTYDYSRFFLEWAKKDVASWIRQNRNHPSIIMWCIGNEIYDTHAGSRGQELTKWLCDMVYEHDYRRNASCTISSNYMPWENARKCADIVKLAGYNYAEKYYDEHHAKYPDWVIYGSETASTVQSRGIYHFPLSQSVLADDDEQCSSLGNSSTSWGARCTEKCIIDDRNASYSPGQFIWTGFDYIGEPTPYHTKNSYFGQIDTAGFPKDSYYIYQAEWTSYKDKPMIHIYPYWDFSRGQLIDVRVCSNAPKIELFLNSITQGIVEIDHLYGDKLLGEWQIPYCEGTLKAVAYDEADRIIAAKTISSFGDVNRLVLTTDETSLRASGNDLAFIEISGIDRNGNPVENATNRIHFTVDGPGILVGIDNGDSTDYEPYKGYSKRMFSGKLLAVISSTFTSGDITITATSPSLEPVSLVIPSLPCEITKGSCEPIPYPETIPMDEISLHEISLHEIPIRKLEIICPEGNLLSRDTPTIKAYIKVHPENATYKDYDLRITNVAGIPSNIIELETQNNEVTLTALSDGTAYLRCLTKNGRDKISMYSHMEFIVTGFGTAYLNPYEFISAGLYTTGSDNLTNGNERGIATARDGKSIIGFERVDFGEFGSDEITLPIFSLDSEEFRVEIWEGIPDRDSATLITIVTYQKTSIWNVYQEEVYTLPKRLKGLTTISFVLDRKIHLKGFCFTPLHKACMKLNILEYSSIYGDSYSLCDSSIENIGNNVSIVFNGMDFVERKANKITICGHSPIDKNTIHIHFTNNHMECVQIIEFDYSKDYVEKTFDLEPITGDITVTFVFLPGSQFDFKWFQFHSLLY